MMSETTAIKAGRFVTLKETTEIECEKTDLRYAQVNGLYGRVKAIWDYNPDKFIVEFGGTHGYFSADELDLMTDTPPDLTTVQAERIAELEAALESIKRGAEHAMSDTPPGTLAESFVSWAHSRTLDALGKAK